MILTEGFFRFHLNAGDFQQVNLDYPNQLLRDGLSYLRQFDGHLCLARLYTCRVRLITPFIEPLPPQHTDAFLRQWMFIPSAGLYE